MSKGQFAAGATDGMVSITRGRCLAEAGNFHVMQAQINHSGTDGQSQCHVVQCDRTFRADAALSGTADGVFSGE